MIMESKRCSRCKEIKPVTEFWIDRSSSSGYRSYCKSCKSDRSAYHKQWHKAKLKENPDYWKEREAARDPEIRRTSNRKFALKKKYNLSLEDYDRMLKEQNGKCAICKKRESFNDSGKELAVDHNHDTGEVRGLLCQVCNQALGMFGDSPEILQSAIEYLNARSALGSEASYMHGHFG